MNRETVIETIKAIASGMSDEQVANLADMELEEVEAFKTEYAQVIEERKRAVEGFGA